MVGAVAYYMPLGPGSKVRIVAHICTLLASLTLLILMAFLFYNTAFDYDQTRYPDGMTDIPKQWHRRAVWYAQNYLVALRKHQVNLLGKDASNERGNLPVVLNVVPLQSATQLMIEAEKTRSTESRHLEEKKYIVCYYDCSRTNDTNKVTLKLSEVNASLCTHINIGSASVLNSSLVLSNDLVQTLTQDAPILRSQNPGLKLLLWIGGADNDNGFGGMVETHATRKVFIQSVKQTLHQYKLDGIDLDWEFPRPYKKQRQHFSQLLYEIKQEYIRERKDYLLTVAVAAPEGIALFAYDVREINKYADFANLMTYDYHFYTSGTPFTGLNAPLFPRQNENSILSTFNINYSVNWWLSKGLDPKKLVVGLPTYGHSFTLVNPLNKKIGAPAKGYGYCGSQGFTTYSETCWFMYHNPLLSKFYDTASCSPYISSGTEWISFENEMSMECKTLYIKSMQLGGVMIFALNTDDFQNFCDPQDLSAKTRFPLIETVKRVLGV